MIVLLLAFVAGIVAAAIGLRTGGSRRSAWRLSAIVAAAGMVLWLCIGGIPTHAFTIPGWFAGLLTAALVMLGACIAVALWPRRSPPAPPVVAGQAGLYPWFKEWDLDLVHPDDRAEWASLSPPGKVFICDAVEPPYIVLRYGSRRFRVKPKLFRPVPVPRFLVGDRVTLREKGVVAEVIDMGWHHKRNEPMYFVAIDGKKKKRRYWASDFE